MSEYFKYLLIVNYIDLIEILFFSSAIYYFSIWLRQDSQKKLLPIFYSFCLLIIMSYAMQMTTLYTSLIAFAPLIIMLFILLHQNTLQKNFIALKNITPSKTESSDWLEIFMRSCLVAANNNKKIIAVIEDKDSIENYLNSNYKMQPQTPISKELIDVILKSPTFDENKMIWVSTQGYLQAINASWNLSIENLWISKEVQNLDDWKQESIIFTSKNDTLIFRIDSQKRLFDIVAQGKLIENVLPNNAIQFIQQLVRKNQINLKKGYNKNEINFKTTTSTNQPNA